MFNSIHIVLKLNDPDHPQVVDVHERLVNVCKHQSTPVVSQQMVTDRSLIVAIGGDGTMLEAMKIAATHGATCFGINLGRIGFLTDVSAIVPSQFGSLETIFEAILSGTIQYNLEYRTVLMGMLNGVKQLACNEFAISPHTSDTMFQYHLCIDGISAGFHRANSLLISTATGSTAYSLAAGGALLYPTLQAIQIVPVAPATMTSRPIIVPASSTIEVYVQRNDIGVRSDGWSIGACPSVITFHQTQRPVRVLHLPDWNYFQTLKEKLGWIKE